jgi:dihydroorotase
VYISSLSKGNGANLEGKHIAEISESREMEPADCMMDLLLEQDGKVSIVFFHMADADVDQVVRWERSLIASDSLHDQAEKPHPVSTAPFHTLSPGTYGKTECLPLRRPSGR